jgi:hypothetical protein
MPRIWTVPCAGFDIIARTQPTTLPAERERRRFGAVRLDEAALCVEAASRRQAVYLAGLRNHPGDPRTEIVMRGPDRAVPVVTERRAPGLMTAAQACGEQSGGPR